MKKLVRDKIPNLIVSEEKRVPRYHISKGMEFYIYLKEKIKEEAQEFIESDNVEELADLTEVIYAILKYKKVTKGDFEKVRKYKLEGKGGFKKGIILDV